MSMRKETAGLFLTIFIACCGATVLGQTASPTITNVRIEGTNLVVTANIPAGIQRVTLETSDRSGRPRWAPRLVTRGETEAREVTFRLPMSRPLELIRIRADATEPLPADFFRGTNAFVSPADSTWRSYLDTTVGVGPGATAPPNSVAQREVVESDIWQIRGTTLYFFNQYRGLQVIDISNPDLAFVRGTVELPAAGDQMYVLGGDHVVLLAREGCNYDQSQLVVVADTGGPPKVLTRLPVPGTIIESRLVGTALYVASQLSRPVPNTTNTVWEWGTQVSAFDFSTPASPVARGTLWYPGYGNVVTATDTYLFVVTQSSAVWSQSVLNLIDITDPGASMAAFGAITNRGQILDKFKINYREEVLAVISEDRQPTNGAPLVTRLQTFQVPDPRSGGPEGIVKLGELELGHGERLHATRFDGQIVYVVTFFQIDPLWVVDFSNPRAPRIAGSLDVPGWSTFIQPLGDRLVTLGIETNHVSVSLYDVSNPAQPSRLSQVRLGANYSWSEANYDEKAFTVLADAGLVLVPYSGDTTNGYTSALQLIDYSRTALRARGQVRSESGLSYRRATVFKDRVLSLSDWELASVNASDRDNPIVAGRLKLAESVDRLILAGEYLLQFSTGNSWNNTTPTLSVAAVGAPTRVLERLRLLSLPLMGTAKNGERLYVLQGTSGWTERTELALTVFSLTNLPSVPLVSQSVTNIKSLGWSTEWQAFWPNPNVLVWAGGQDYWWWCDVWVGGGPVVGSGLLWQPFMRGNGGNGKLVAYDAREADMPGYASQVDLTSRGGWGFSRAFEADALFYVSRQVSEFIPDPGQTNTGRWVYRTSLDVVDFEEPGDPLVRDPVNIPNPLTGLAKSGALLFSVGSHWNSDPTTDSREYLDASAYDGVSAHLVDSLALPSAWPHPVHVLDRKVIIGNPGEDVTTTGPTLETWSLSNEGKFVRLNALKVASAVGDLASFPGLLAATDSVSGVNLFDATDPAALRLVGTGRTPLCWWWPDFAHADGGLPVGLWLPLSAYGVTHITTEP